MHAHWATTWISMFCGSGGDVTVNRQWIMVCLLNGEVRRVCVNEYVCVSMCWRHVIPGSVPSPWCGLCYLHPLCSAWSCCSTSRSRAAAGSASPPAQSQTPEGGQRKNLVWGDKSAKKTGFQMVAKTTKKKHPFVKTTSMETGITTRPTKIMTNKTFYIHKSQYCIF